MSYFRLNPARMLDLAAMEIFFIVIVFQLSSCERRREDTCAPSRHAAERNAMPRTNAVVSDTPPIGVPLAHLQSADVDAVTTSVRSIAREIAMSESNYHTRIAIERLYDNEGHAAATAQAIAKSAPDDRTLYLLARKAHDNFLAYHLLSTVYARTTALQVKEDATLALLVLTKEQMQKYDETLLIGQAVLNNPAYREDHMLVQAALKLMGDACVKKKDYTQAIAYYDRLYLINTRAHGGPYPALLLAEAYAHLKRYDKTAQYLDEAEALVSPEDGMQTRIDAIRRKIPRK